MAQQRVHIGVAADEPCAGCFIPGETAGFAVAGVRGVWVGKKSRAAEARQRLALRHVHQGARS